MSPSPVLSHFAVFAFRPSFFALKPADRIELDRELRAALAGVAEAVHVYASSATRSGSDLIVWSTVAAKTTRGPAEFLTAWAEAVLPFRRHAVLADSLWGFTRESEYARGAPVRGIDPLRPEREPYLVVYPFSKTPDWYRLDAEDRARIMREHIRVGRGHDGIDQLLLYTTGLQDHEFVVVYETADLQAFSRLVSDLRATEARPYTLRDSPVHVGVHTPPPEPSGPP